MAWTYWTFNDIRLPYLNAEADLGTPTLAPAIVPAVGGLWDTFGAEVRTMTAAHQFQLRGVLALDNNGVEETALVLSTARTTAIVLSTARTTAIVLGRAHYELEAWYDQLAAQLGKRGSLVVRDPLNTTVARTKQARLLRLERMQNVRQGTEVIEVALLFESSQALWS